MSEQEEKAIELAKIILAQQDPNSEYDQAKAVQQGNAPIFDVYFLRGRLYTIVQVEVL